MNKTFKIKIPSSFLFLSRFSFSPPSHEQDVPVSVGLSERLRFQISPVGGFNEVLSVKPDDSRGQTNQISALWIQISWKVYWILIVMFYNKEQTIIYMEWFNPSNLINLDEETRWFSLYNIWFIKVDF